MVTLDNFHFAKNEQLSKSLNTRRSFQFFYKKNVFDDWI